MFLGLLDIILYKVKKKDAFNVKKKCNVTALGLIVSCEHFFIFASSSKTFFILHAKVLMWAVKNNMQITFFGKEFFRGVKRYNSREIKIIARNIRTYFILNHSRKD